MTALDALLGALSQDGDDVELMSGIDVISPLTLTPNNTTRKNELGIALQRIDLAAFTVATLPAASSFSGQIARVSDGFNGRPCLAMSDGASWWVIATQLGLVKSGVPSATLIVGGVLTVLNAVDIAVDTEAAAASDDLDTISGTVAGQIVILRAVDSARTVVVKDGTGNLRLAGDCSLNNHEDRIVLRSNGTLLYELSRSDNGA